MPCRSVPDSNARYILVAVDKEGNEHPADPDAPRGLITERVTSALLHDDITDVFVWIHGWKGDVKEAFAQYDRWIGAFSKSTLDRQEMLSRRSGFKELHVGLHWPSLAWGDEGLVPGDSFAPGPGVHASALVDFHARELGDSPAVRSALQRLFDELRRNSAEPVLTAKARDAYLELDQALALGADGAAGDGSADRSGFDPDQTVAVADYAAFGGGFGSNLLAPLRQLTFWTMKKRAKTVGQTALVRLLASMQHASPTVRVHMMGHSFGCVVASSALVAPAGKTVLPRPVDSCVLIQGAASLWAFARTNPYQGEAGFFHAILSENMVRGPLVATRSRFDYALGNIYPWAAGAANQVAFDGLPQFGAIGIYGLCGVPAALALPMNARQDAYRLAPGGIYNIDASEFICKLDGLSGAHSDIAGPEVAHLIWQAALPDRSEHAD